MFDPTVRQYFGLLGSFAAMVWVQKFPYKGDTANQYKVVLSYHLYPIMDHFYLDGNGPFKDENSPIQRA